MAGGLAILLDRYPALRAAGLSELSLDDLRGDGYAPTQSPAFTAWQVAAHRWANGRKGKAANTDHLVIAQVGHYTQRVGYEGAQVLCFTAEELAAALEIKPDTARGALKRLTDETDGVPPLKRIVRGAPRLYGSVYAIAPFLDAQAKNPNTPPKSGFCSDTPKPRFRNDKPPDTRG